MDNSSPYTTVMYVCPRCGIPTASPGGHDTTAGCPINVNSGNYISIHGYIPARPSGTIPHRCPVCNGTGLVSRPPGVAGDQEEWASSSCGPYPCRSCGGSGVLWR